MIANRAGALLIPLVLLSAGHMLSAQSAPTFPDWLTPCTPPDVQGPALCGRYEVFENRTTRAGRRIALRILVLPARGPERAPDPVFYFAGGPGDSSVGSANGISALLAAVRERRDLVFIDLRGTGDSHALRCAQPADDAPLQEYFGEFLPDAFVKTCRAAQDADVALYANPIAVQDVEEVRIALGYGPINLYGISGGTRTAQVYMRAYPASIRSAVLKGVVPMDMENPLPHARSLETSVHALIEACAAEAACSRAFPDLTGDWERSKQWFERGPVEATVRHPRTGRTERVRIGRGTFADGVRHVLYSINASRALPTMIHDAAAGDFDAFAQRELEQVIGFSRIADGAFMSATCGEDLRFVSEEDITRATDGTFLGDYRVRRQLAACGIWGYGAEVDAEFQESVKSNVPALLISGAVDAATPPDGAERVASALSAARHVIFPNQSHDFANRPCEQRIMTQFIEAGTAKGLDVGCAATTRRPPFLIDGREE